MSQHTPTPWKFKKIADHGARITDSKDFTIAIIRRNLDDPFDNAKKDSEFIVTAVNAHEDLVKALKSVLNSGRGSSGRIILDLKQEESLTKALEKAGVKV